MGDGYWNQQRQYQPPLSSTPHGGPPKRHRSDFEGPPSTVPSGHDMHSYLSRDENRGIPLSVNDTRTIGSAYDRYLKSVQTPSVPSEEAGPFDGVGMGRQGGNNIMRGPPMGELMAGRGGSLPSDFRPNGRAMGFDQLDSVGRPGREPLLPDVSNTLYVEGLPSNCSRREVSPTALSALQGYRMDEDESDSKILRLQFSRNPGPRPGQRGGRR